MKKLLLFCIAILLAFGQTSVGSARGYNSYAKSMSHGPASSDTTVLDWGSLADSGPYTLAPGLTNYVVDNPDGTNPAYSDLGSLRYHHHTRVAVDSSGRVWVAYSGNLTGEDQSGEITEVNSSA